MRAKIAGRLVIDRIEERAVSIVMNRTRPTGRHRLGRPGLIPVSALVTVVRRGFIRSWWRPARHRYVESPATRRVGVRAPAAA